LFFVLLTYLVYNTVVRLSQFFCCGRKANLVRIFLLNLNLLLVHRNKVSVTVYLFLALYGSTKRTIMIVSQQYQDFSLISETKLIGFLYFRETTR
jgi:hypothetical protein